MSVEILLTAAAVVGGAAVGLLNGWLTSRVLERAVSVNRVMLVNLLHLLLAAVYLLLVTLACRFLGVDASKPLLLGAAGLVLVPILMAALRKGQK